MVSEYRASNPKELPPRNLADKEKIKRKEIPSWELTYPPEGTFKDDFPFPQVGYVSSQEGIWFRITGFLEYPLTG